jgi:hypothetical protein
LRRSIPAGLPDPRRRRGCLPPLLLVALLAAPAARAASIADSWQRISWGESSAALLARFGARATVVARPLDFGDSYAQIVRRDIAAGGFPLVAFYQMDKTTGGLKRVQIERNRHGVNPPAFRAVASELEAAYGAPDLLCGLRPGPASGYQAAAERIWRRDGAVIRAIFRDTTIEAFEGCLAGDPSLGPCGRARPRRGRISPPEADAGSCPAPARRR